MHRLVVLALHGVIPFDLSIPTLVFGLARLEDGRPAYDVIVCGEAARVRARPFDIHVPTGLDALAQADTIVVAGVDDVSRPVPARVLKAIQAAWERGTRVVSICSGTFVLAATGLLDGRRATTHWIGASQLAERHPAVVVDPNVLFVDEGRIVTSAGAAAGLDMCLHLVRRDHGHAVAAATARLAVAPLDRDGGQAQFIHHEPPGSEGSLNRLLEWMGQHCAEALSIGALAARAGMTERTFARKFREQTGTTPLQWLLAARIRSARELLETSSRSVEDIGTATGFESAASFRARFNRTVGVAPAVYRRRFNAKGEPARGRLRADGSIEVGL